MSALVEALALLVERTDLAPALMRSAMEELLSGDAEPARIAAFAIALRMKGETVDELTAAAEVLRERALPVHVSEDTERVILDTCGTGGDGVGSFNVSTAAAFVAAACGVTVAKHGNRAVSSRAGSADVLEALGARIDLGPERVRESIASLGVGFLFAPAHHGALRHAAPVRRALSVRTFFNLLGPLASPARATHQLLGVFDPNRLETMASVLGKLGVRGAWVVHGLGGLDEISPLGPTDVAVLRDGAVQMRRVAPEDFGLAPGTAASLRGGDARENALIIREVLGGARVAARLVVVLNAAAALVVAERESDLRRATERVVAALDAGTPLELLDRFVAFSVEGA